MWMCREGRDSPLTLVADCIRIFLSCDASPLLGAWVVTAHPFCMYLRPTINMLIRKQNDVN